MLKRTAVLLASVAFVLWLAVPSAAQPEPGNCSLGTAQAELSVNNVRARLFNIGALFWREDDPVYFVPKSSDVSPMFAHTFWVGGKVDGQLRMAATQYDNHEFWPGPLLEDGSLPPTTHTPLPNPADCAPFDRLYSVTRADVHAYYATGRATPDLAEWPADLGAPFYDHDGDGAYDLAAGDQPLLRGDQVVWWVMNDVGNAHHETETPPLGIEVRVEAFARVSTVDAINDATFYRYTVLYRGDAPVDSLYYGFFTDTDLGAEYTDDYVGSDSLRGLGYTYNADNSDDGGYGEAPPALGVDLLDGAEASSYVIKSGRYGYPSTGIEYYRWLTGRHKDGSPWTYGGFGTDQDQPRTRWRYSGVPGGYWSEACSEVDAQGDCSRSIAPNDRRFITSSHMHRMMPGDTLTFHYAVLWARGACHYGCPGSSVDRLFQASDYVQNAYDLGDLTAARPVPVPFGQGAEPPPGAFGLGAAFPNPGAARVSIRYDVPEQTEGRPLRLTVYDVLGREVTRLVDGPAVAGRQTATVDAAEWPSGVYLYRLAVVGGRSESRRFTVIH
jgi:hypothetical protein